MQVYRLVHEFTFIYRGFDFLLESGVPGESAGDK